MEQSEEQIAYEGLAKRLSEITGKEIAAPEFMQFENRLGSYESPVCIVPDILWGYSGTYTRNITYDVTFVLKPRLGKITVQKANLLSEKKPSETVVGALDELVKMYENPDLGLKGAFDKAERFSFVEVARPAIKK